MTAALTVLLNTVSDDLSRIAQAGFAIDIKHQSPSEGWHVLIRTPVPQDDPRWHIYGEGDDLDFEEAIRMAVTLLAQSMARFEADGTPVPGEPVLRIVPDVT